jgi:hypothetical protein
MITIPRKKVQGIRGLCLGIACLLAPWTLGQEGPVEPEPAEQPPAAAEAPAPPPDMGFSWTLDLEGVHSFDAKFEDADGGFDRTRLASRLAVLGPVSSQLLLGASFGVGASIYQFDGQTGLLPGEEEPWETVQTYSIGANAIILLDRQWRMFVSANLSSSGEGGATFEDTLTVGGTVAARYAVSETLILGAGVTVQTRLEDSLFVLPFPTVDWTLPFDEAKWRLVVGEARIGPSRAAGFSLRYTPVEELEFAAGVGAFGLGGDFRLDEDGPVPGGVGRDTSVPALIGAEWRPNRTISINALVGVALMGELELTDSNGTRIGREDVDPAVVFGAGVSFSF